MRWFGRKRNADSFVLNGEWTGEIWDFGPVVVPAEVDVPSFLAQSPMPSIRPLDREFNKKFNGEDEAMRRFWLLAFLHHPDRTVVEQSLRSGQLGWVHAEEVAYFLVDPTLADAAVEATWNMSETAFRSLVNFVLSRGMLPSDFPERHVDKVVELLRSTCPPDRTEFLETQLAD